jgi:hypothetical protein
MRRVELSCLLALLSAWTCAAFQNEPSEKEVLRNANVVAVEYKLGPGEILAIDGLRPAVTVYLDSGTLAENRELAQRKLNVERGKVEFSPSGGQTIRNSSQSALHFVRVEFLGPGGAGIWGMSGLPPNYKLLLENSYTRVYDIRIAAGSTERQHTHHNRVVICLSGAKLKHTMPDGREETATLQTGEVAWRLGATHVGHNLGDTDLWVIAVEPK